MSAEFSPDGSITGGAGCNSYRGSYVSSDDTISVDAVSFTEIGCTEPEGILEQEERFLLMLSDSATFEIDADALTLTTASGETLLFHLEGTIPDDNGSLNDDSLDDDASNANSSSDDVSNADSSLVGAWTLRLLWRPRLPRISTPRRRDNRRLLRRWHGLRQRWLQRLSGQLPVRRWDPVLRPHGHHGNGLPRTRRSP